MSWYVDLLHKKISEPNNAWDNEQTGVNGFSKIVDTRNLPHLSIFGRISATTTIAVYVSEDGVDFYYCGRITETIVPQPGPPQPAESFPQDFHTYPTVGARYIRLLSSADVVASATIVAKP